MDRFEKFGGVVVPIDRQNVDTDVIIPKQFLKSIRRTGFGDNLFDEWRYLDHGEPGQDCSVRPRNHDFALNESRFHGARIMLARANFGCGSSREHAAWALRDYGIRALIAPSFADIFYGNCFKNGLLPIVLAPDWVDRLFEWTLSENGLALEIDLAAQTVSLPNGEVLRFEVDSWKKECLLEGLDDIAITLGKADRIRSYEARRRADEPWLFAR